MNISDPKPGERILYFPAENERLPNNMKYAPGLVLQLFDGKVIHLSIFLADPTRTVGLRTNIAHADIATAGAGSWIFAHELRADVPSNLTNIESPYSGGAAQASNSSTNADNSSSFKKRNKSHQDKDCLHESFGVQDCERSYQIMRAMTVAVKATDDPAIIIERIMKDFTDEGERRYAIYLAGIAHKTKMEIRGLRGHTAGVGLREVLDQILKSR